MPYEIRDKVVWTCARCGKERTLTKPPQVGARNTCSKCKNVELYTPPTQPALQFVQDSNPAQLTPSQPSAVQQHETALQPQPVPTGGSYFDKPSIANNIWASAIWWVGTLILPPVLAYFVTLSTARSTFRNEVDESIKQLEIRLYESLKPLQPEVSSNEKDKEK